MVRGEHLFGDWPQASAIGFVFGRVFRPRRTPSREFRNAPEWAAVIRPTQSILFFSVSFVGQAEAFRTTCLLIARDKHA